MGFIKPWPGSAPVWSVRVVLTLSHTPGGPINHGGLRPIQGTPPLLVGGGVRGMGRGHSLSSPSSFPSLRGGFYQALVRLSEGELGPLSDKEHHRGRGEEGQINTPLGDSRGGLRGRGGGIIPLSLFPFSPRALKGTVGVVYISLPGVKSYD